MQEHTQNAYTRGLNAGVLLAVVAFLVCIGITLLTDFILKL